MRKIFYSFLLIGVTAISVVAQPRVTKEEYAVYASVLKSIRSDQLERSKEKYSFVILNNTFRADDFNPFGKRRFRSLSRDFVRKNRVSAKLVKSIPVNYEYTIISRPDVDELLKIGTEDLEKVRAEYARGKVGMAMGYGSSVWKRFYASFPNTNGYYQFSRVGFSPDKKFALVSIEGTGSSWSGADTHILRKNKGKWQIYMSSGSFIIAGTKYGRNPVPNG